MRYLKKQLDSRLSQLSLSYDRAADRRQIRELLLSEQGGYCAYSERFVHHTDSCDIEHFAPRLKSTAKDDYWNWYAVLSWMNSHKPKKIDPFLPLPNPYDATLVKRIRFANGLFEAISDSDTEAKNLIAYLRWNHESLVKDRAAHLENLRFIRSMFGSLEDFADFIREDPHNLSFLTAIEAEFKINF